MRSDAKSHRFTPNWKSMRTGALKLVVGAFIAVTLVIGVSTPADAAIQTGIAVQCVDDSTTGSEYVQVLDVFQRSYTAEVGYYWLRVKRWAGGSWSTTIDTGWKKIYLAGPFEYLIYKTSALANGYYTVEVYHSVAGVTYGPFRDANGSYEYLHRHSTIYAPIPAGVSGTD